MTKSDLQCHVLTMVAWLECRYVKILESSATLLTVLKRETVNLVKRKQHQPSSSSSMRQQHKSILDSSNDLF